LFFVVHIFVVVAVYAVVVAFVDVVFVVIFVAIVVFAATIVIVVVVFVVLMDSFSNIRNDVTSVTHKSQSKTVFRIFHHHKIYICKPKVFVKF